VTTAILAMVVDTEILAQIVSVGYILPTICPYEAAGENIFTSITQSHTLHPNH